MTKTSRSTPITLGTVLRTAAGVLGAKASAPQEPPTDPAAIADPAAAQEATVPSAAATPRAATTPSPQAAPTTDEEPTMTATPVPAAPLTPPPAIAAVPPPKRRWLYNPSSTYLAAFDCDAVADDGRPTSRWFELPRRENRQVIEVDDETAQRVLAGGRLGPAG